MHNKISLLLLLILLSIPNHQVCSTHCVPSNNDTKIDNEILVGVGVILDLESWIGKSIHICISMAISDFYALNHNYRTKIVLHTRNSKGDPIEALSAVDDLLNNVKVKAIIGPETHLQSKLLALFADKVKVPIFSFAGSSSTQYPYFFQIKEDESSMAKGISSLMKSYKWKNATFVYEDTDDEREILPYLIESLHEKNIHITYKSAISSSATPVEITKELQKLMTFHTNIHIVHMSPSLASSFFLNAKRLGMVKEEYAYILTETTADVLRSEKFEVMESLQGAIGFRSYVPASSRLYKLTARWQKFFYRKYPTMVTKEVPVPAIRAYDTIWALAECVEKVEVPHNGASLLNEVLKMKFKGVSGEFQLSEGKVLFNGYEIMTSIDYSETRIGYYTLSEGIRRVDRKINSVHLYSGVDTEAATWREGSTTGRVLLTTSSKKLKIGVLKIKNFKYFMDLKHDAETNSIIPTGFSIDVFNTCIRALPYEVPYTFISYENATYDDLVRKVYNKEIDAVVGDSTILPNRSEFVDFTATYSDMGVGTLARIKKKDMWFFLKPLDVGLWLTAIASLFITGFVIWAIECMHPGSECSPSQQIGTIFWLILLTIFYAQREKLSSNMSKFVMYVWLLVVLILITGYTATLASLLTVEQFELASNRGIVGFHGNSFMRGVTVSNLHFEDHKHRAYYSYEDYAHALSEDGEADAIVDEIPYIKMFLGIYAGDYALVSSHQITSGFGFIFRKGSPLVQDMSREIAKLRQDGTLESLEKKWFEKRFSILSRNSTMPKVLKLDRFGGLFISNGINLAVALTVSAICLLYTKMKILNIISFVLGRDFMAAIRYLVTRKPIGRS
uniref:glutamate receptor 1.2-like n=1 Tax=Erigeron canadensis TaxID=72917 RepID=UPI001CB9C8A9|nr:glutamate receptor 1.2-like [Erigeron canadensis]